MRTQPDRTSRRVSKIRTDVVCEHRKIRQNGRGTYLDEIEEILVVLLEVQVQEIRSVKHGRNDVLYDAVFAVHDGYERQTFSAARYQHALAEYGSLERHSGQQVSRLGLHLEQRLGNESEFAKQ